MRGHSAVSRRKQSLVLPILVCVVIIMLFFAASHWMHPVALVPADRPVFISAARVATIRSAVANQRNPNYRAWRDGLLGECQNALGAGQHAPQTVYVPGFYVDPVGHGRAKEAIKADANNVYALGLCYRVTDEERYADAAASIIAAWASTVQTISSADDTTLVLSYHFPAMIFGADLIRSSRAYAGVAPAFTAFLQQKLAQASSIDWVSRAGCGYSGAGIPSNNWSDWGTVLTISIGAFTNDTALFDQAVQKWQANIVYQVDRDGNLPMEQTRNNCTGEAGIYYTNFAMQALTITAEIAANNGIDLFHYTSGGTMPYLRAWQRTAQLTRYPDTFAFATAHRAAYTDFRYDTAWMEIANNYVPNEDGRWLLERFRPMVSREVFRYATLTHGDLPIALPTAEPVDPNGPWMIRAAAVSSDDGNTPGNVLHGNYATRWSAQAGGQ